MKITHTHSNIGVFNGWVYFLIGDRLASIEVCTPNFNDYNEWRLRDLRISSEAYVTEDVELTPYKIPDYDIDEDEFNFLLKHFEAGSYDEDDLQPDHPILQYLGEELMVSVNFEDGFKAYINEFGSYNTDLDKFDKSEWKLLSDIPDDLKLYEPMGMCYFLAELNYYINKNFYNEV